MHMCGIHMCTDMHAYTAIHIYVLSCKHYIYAHVQAYLKRIMKCLQFKLRVFQG